MRGGRSRPPTPSRMNGAISRKSGSWTELAGGGSTGIGGSGRARRVSVDECKTGGMTPLNLEGSRRSSEDSQQKSSRSDRGDGEGVNVKVCYSSS